MTTVLEWAEKAGLENLRDHANNAELMQRQVSTLLTLLLSGAGAALYFAVANREFIIASVVISLWLFGIAAILTLKCLMFGDFPSVWNEPKNLNLKGYSLSQLREYELENLQERISDAARINFIKSLRLNNCILATCFTPLIGILTLFVSASRFCA